jgi:hypothetical protein
MVARFEDLRRLQPAIDRAAHGTRSCYVGQRCRCDLCKAANRAWYHQRQERLREAAIGVQLTPNGPPGEKPIGGGGGGTRVGKTCPGANGAPCVRGGTWLKNGGPVCVACVDRHTVWNGLVDAARARAHLRALSAQGVGYKSVHAASDVAASVLAAVIDGSRTKIRADTERAIFAVDASAIADHAPVPAGPTLELVEKMRARGFTRSNIARLLGYKTKALQLGVTGDQVIAKSAAAVERLWRRIERGEVLPESPFEDAGETWAILHQLAAAGLSWAWLSERVGFHVNPQRQGARVRKEHAARVRELVAEMERMHREGEGLPDGWQAPAGGIAAAFGYEGGWGWERRTSKKKQREEQRELRELAAANHTSTTRRSA